MVRITNTIDIDASTEQVYSALRTLDAYPTWLRHSTVYHGTKMPTPQAGATLTYEDSTMVGRMRGELIEDVPDHALQFHQSKPSGSLDALIRYDLDAAETGTHLTRVGELTTHGMLRMVQPILLRMAAAESERTMKSLKTHCEHST
ncbi:SRPBCC family protein [Leifsonia sp. YAF41]|uniref:SRPBCC family protein n=1 Tax=Leifsonia sp. YAF41 TaxID=3233086 RepID=UPI003F9612B9